MNRSSRRGFTLTEIMIGSTIGLIVSAATFAFANHQTRTLSLTSNAISMNQTGRSMIDQLADDVRHAGVGIGYRADDSFAGLLLGDFAIDGVSFSSDSTSVDLAYGATPTDDLGILLADGARSTIAGFSLGGSGQLCAGTELEAGELAVIRSEDGMAARTVRVDSLSPATCTEGQCVNGCQSFFWTAMSGFQTEATAASASYLGGELAGGLRTIVWFVEASDSSRQGIGALRRAVFDGRASCDARDASCGSLMAEYVETLQFQVWAWDAASSAWQNVTAGPISGNDRLRVDLEIVVRAKSEGERRHSPTVLRLETSTCVPDCDQPDKLERRVLRTSVEIKNSGRMVMR